MFRIMGTSAPLQNSVNHDPSAAVTSLEAMRANVREKIESRFAAAKLEVEGWTRQLADFDREYETPPTPTEVISAHRSELVAAVKNFREGKSISLTPIKNFSVSFGYMEVTELMVFSVTGCENVNFSFTSDDITELFSILKEAGFKGPFNHWNGAGLFTFSVKPPLSQMVLSPEVEASI